MDENKTSFNYNGKGDVTIKGSVIGGNGNKVHYVETINAPTGLEGASKARLDNLLAQLNHELKKVPASRSSDVEKLTRWVTILLDGFSGKSLDNKEFHATVELFLDRAKQLIDVIPEIKLIADQIVRLLSLSL